MLSKRAQITLNAPSAMAKVYMRLANIPIYDDSTGKGIVAEISILLDRYNIFDSTDSILKNLRIIKLYFTTFIGIVIAGVAVNFMLHDLLMEKLPPLRDFPENSLHYQMPSGKHHMFKTLLFFINFSGMPKLKRGLAALIARCVTSPACTINDSNITGKRTLDTVSCHAHVFGCLLSYLRCHCNY